MKTIIRVLFILLLTILLCACSGNQSCPSAEMESYLYQAENTSVTYEELVSDAANHPKMKLKNGELLKQTQAEFELTDPPTWIVPLTSSSSTGESM